MAKAMPSAPADVAVLTPMTRPASSSKGPPLLPGLMAASRGGRKPGLDHAASP
jgi:hypothetical protein